MLIPYVQFHEIIQSYAPVLANIRNRIGMVGEFTRGPVGEFSFIGGFSDFARRYGADSTRGSMAFQAAWDQGAREFGLIRILGRAKPAEVTIRFSGVTTKTNTLFLHLRYVGEAINRTDRAMTVPIFPGGIPVNESNGRFWFRVMDIDPDTHIARIKFHFLADGVNNEIDWFYGEPGTFPLLPVPIYPLPQADPLGYLPAGYSNYFQNALTPDQSGVIINPDGFSGSSDIAYRIPPEGVFYINVQEDSGLPVAIGNGITLSFGSSTQLQTLSLAAGDTWTVRINSLRWDVPVYEGALPNQVCTSIIEKMQGRDPIGEISRTIQDDGIVIPLQEELAGSLGNRFSFFIEGMEPDGEVITEVAYFSGEKYVSVPLKVASYIQNNAYLELIPGGGMIAVDNFSNPQDPNGPAPDPIIIPSGTKVVKVEVPEWGNMALVWLDKAITAPFNSLAMVRFMNPLGLSYTYNTWYQTTYLRGGEDGPRRAFRDFYDLNGIPLLRIMAANEGSWGNSLRLDLYPITNEVFRLVVRDLNKASYSPPMSDEVFEVSFLNSTNEGVLTDIFGSNHIQALFLPKALNPTSYNVNLARRSPMRLAPPDVRKSGTQDPANPLFYGPEYLKNVSLEDGYNGPPLRESDYTYSLDILAQQPAHIILTPGIWSDLIRQKLISQAESSQELTGLRVAILNARPRLTPEGAKGETIGYDSKRAVMIAGWSTYAGQPNAARFSLSPDALLAGKLSGNPYWISPAARTSAGPVVGISEVDTQPYSTVNQLNQYSLNRLEILAMDPALSTFYFMTGRTISSDTRWLKISKRRSYDVVRMDLYLALQIYKSEPLTAILLRQIASSIDAYMNTKARNGHISGYTSSNVVIVDAVVGMIEVSLSFSPIGSADYIDVYLIDQMQSSGAGAGLVLAGG